MVPNYTESPYYINHVFLIFRGVNVNGGWDS